MPGYRCEVKQGATLIEAVVVDADDLKLAHDKALADVQREKKIEGLRVTKVEEMSERIVAGDVKAAGKGARK
jgi:hypothetical protein